MTLRTTTMLLRIMLLRERDWVCMESSLNFFIS